MTEPVDYLDSTAEWAAVASEMAIAMREALQQFWTDETDGFRIEMGTTAFLLAFADWIAAEYDPVDADAIDRISASLRERIRKVRRTGRFNDTHYGRPPEEQVALLT